MMILFLSKTNHLRTLLQGSWLSLIVPFYDLHATHVWLDLFWYVATAWVFSALAALGMLGWRHLRLNRNEQLESVLRATKDFSAKSRAVVVTQAKKDERGVYIGKGKWVQDDESKYAARDNWFTGGWPGGEVGLKEGFIQEPFEKPSEAQKQYDELPDDAKGEDDIYVGKGKYVKGNAKKFAGRDTCSPAAGPAARSASRTRSSSSSRLATTFRSRRRAEASSASSEPSPAGRRRRAL